MHISFVGVLIGNLTKAKVESKVMGQVGECTIVLLVDHPHDSDGVAGISSIQRGDGTDLREGG